MLIHQLANSPIRKYYKIDHSDNKKVQNIQLKFKTKVVGVYLIHFPIHLNKKITNKHKKKG